MASKEDIAKRIVELLSETPLLTARQIAAELDLPGVDKSLVNSIMYLDELKRFTKRLRTFCDLFVVMTFTRDCRKF